MIIGEIREELFKLQDIKYRDFQAKLVPTVEPETIIGIRTPELRKLAKQLVKREDIGTFLQALPHDYYDENMLHTYIISETKDYSRCVEEIDAFLPYVDNWATCDTLIPKAFKKHRHELLSEIDRWIASSETYTVRFAVGTLMRNYLDDDFDPSFLRTVSAIRSEEYYINMMTAWYFATALAKQYDAALPYIEQKKLDPWTHNKAIQKAIESFRVSQEHKDHLRTLKIPTRNRKQ